MAEWTGERLEQAWRIARDSKPDESELLRCELVCALNQISRLRADLAAATARAERAEKQRDRLLAAILDTDEPKKTPVYLRSMADLLNAEGHPMTADFFDDLASALDVIAEKDVL